MDEIIQENFKKLISDNISLAENPSVDFYFIWIKTQMPHFAYKILHGLFSILFQTHLFLFTMVSHWTPAILASCVSLKHMDLDLTMPNSLLPLGLCTSCYLCLPVVCLEHSSLVPSCFLRSRQEACLFSKGEASLKYLIILSHHPILIPGTTVNHVLAYFLFIYYFFSFEWKLLNSKNLMFFFLPISSHYQGQ